MNGLADQFARDGWVGPVPLLSADQCRAALKHLRSDRCAPPAVWPKGGAASDWLPATIGGLPKLIAMLKPLLGEDIVLWGSSLVHRDPGQTHTWHVDIESSAPDGRFVTVWIGLENTTVDSALKLIAGSHLCGKTVQQFQTETGVPREESTTAVVLEWARTCNPAALAVQPAAKDGDAILFDGRMWHGSHNGLETQTRSALLLQFGAADCPVLIPDPKVKTWPFKYSNVLPPAVLVAGTAEGAKHRLVPKPTDGSTPAIRPAIRPLSMSPAQGPEKGWRSQPLVRGPTPALDFMSCHVSQLLPGSSPHVPHAHPDEELLIVLDGEGELLIRQSEDEDVPAVPVKAGDFAFYGPMQHHSIRNVAAGPVTYMMFRWRRPGAPAPATALQTQVFHGTPSPGPVPGREFTLRNIVSAPTRWLRKLHCHTSRLEPGAGYAPHTDAYDVAILTRSGRVRTLQREVGPGSFIYYPAGEMHGMRNVGDEPAEYLVFEFHGAPVQVTASPLRPPVHQPALATQ